VPMIVGQSAEARSLRLRLVLLGAAISISLLVLAGRLYQLQIARGEEYRVKSIENFVKETRLPADRGMILDARGGILVDNRPSYDVTLTPAFCQPRGGPRDWCLNEVLPRLATFLSLSADEVARVKDAFRKARGLERFRQLTVKTDIDLDALDRLQANKLELDGVEVTAVPHRFYRYGTLAAHVLGYMNEVGLEEMESLNRDCATDPEGPSRYQLGDYLGRRGVEQRFEQVLRGRDGTMKTVVDAKGRRIPRSDDYLKVEDRIIPARPGHNVVLSLRLPLQEAAEKAFTGRAGAAAAVDVNTGFLLAALSKPAYDPNKLTGRISRAELKALSEDPLEPLIFRLVQQHYHPGSTWKAVTALAALEAGAIAPGSTRVTCNGGYTLGNRRWRCHNERGHGVVDLHHGLAWSCDVFFYFAGERTGMDPIAAMARQLGFGTVPGLGLSPEVPGVVPTVAYHDRVTPGGFQKGLVLNSAIGQGDTNVSPLQLLMAYAAIANGGTLYRPQVLRRIEDTEGHILRSLDPVVVGRVAAKPETLAAVVDGLTAVVNEPGGTAYWRRPRELKEVVIAGKTGTAQVIALAQGARAKTEEMEYLERDHAWFVAWAPVDHPEIAVVVLNEHAGHGSSAAAPAAMEILKAYFRLKAEEETTRVAPAPAPPPPSPSAEPERASPREACAGGGGAPWS
jgi:penicillin-binding protein 2